MYVHGMGHLIKNPVFGLFLVLFGAVTTKRFWQSFLFWVIIVLILFELALFLAIAIALPGDGRPHCTSEEEINIRLFRNNWDPTSYWICDHINQSAILARCPDQMAYLDSAKDCVDWADWHWEQTADSLLTN